uniref:Uncharacterized protein n=1 Tax=viral metagenome TaxID=1070528 RepID=A0A6C0CPG1_9ZZZZ
MNEIYNTPSLWILIHEFNPDHREKMNRVFVQLRSKFITCFKCHHSQLMKYKKEGDNGVVFFVFKHKTICLECFDRLVQHNRVH